MATGYTLSHWGAAKVTARHGRVVDVEGLAEDRDPSPISRRHLRNHNNRVMRPLVRRSWAEHGPLANPERRGDEDLVEVSWGQAIELASTALDLVRTEQGNEAIFGGSYGWSGAGRFHHAQSQLKRFLNCIGGFVDSVGTYSHGAAEAMVPHLLGVSFSSMLRAAPTPDHITTETELMVSLGGFPAANTQIVSGGDVDHWYRPTLRKAKDRGCRFVAITPNRGPFDDELEADWLPIRPGTDAAMLIGLTGELVAAGHEDEPFLANYCSGVDLYLSYLRGEADGVVKDATWAAAICDVDQMTIRRLAEALARHRTLVNTTWSTQRVEHGEQVVWALIGLGAALGQIGAVGGGIAFGHGSMGTVGAPVVSARPASLPQGENPIETAIPVARLADALADPGGRYRFDGRERGYPTIDLIYWCGGNPFHHHQDLNRLDRLWRRPRAVLVNEPFLTETTRRADVVFPATTSLEREDIGAASTGGHQVFMDRIVEPAGESRDDYQIFTMLAERLGVAERFTEGRTAAQWLARLQEASQQGVGSLPDLDDLRRRHVVTRPSDDRAGPLDRFLDDPAASPLRTESGRIPLAVTNAATLLGPGARPHPSWSAPVEWLGAVDDGPARFHLVSPMPPDRLHSQLADDLGPADVSIAVDDAARLDLGSGALVMVANARGACLARVRPSPRVRPGVVVIENGHPLAMATIDVDGVPTVVSTGGNVNVLTADRPTSILAQATSAHSCLVSITPVSGEVRERGGPWPSVRR